MSALPRAFLRAVSDRVEVARVGAALEELVGTLIAPATPPDVRSDAIEHAVAVLQSIKVGHAVEVRGALVDAEESLRRLIPLASAYLADQGENATPITTAKAAQQRAAAALFGGPKP